MKNSTKVIMSVFLSLAILLCGCIVSSSVAEQKISEENQEAQSGRGMVRYAPDGIGYTYEQDGWHFLHIEGAPFERGYQHGYLMADYIDDTLTKMRELIIVSTGAEWDFFREHASVMWKDKLDSEVKAELEGIAQGGSDAGKKFDYVDLLVYNGLDELTDYWFPTVAQAYYNAQSVQAGPEIKIAPLDTGSDDNCSAFIATGSYTEDGRIVLAHNSFTTFELAYCNMAIDVVPSEGSHFIMQSLPGYIHSFTDLYESEYLIVTETTIGGFKAYDETGIPEFNRIRMAVQFSTSLDEFTAWMLKGNNGGYANTWLAGDLKTNEIMRLELGLKFHKVDKETDGYFVGFNAPLDPRIRNFETTNSGFADIRRHQGARQVRLPQLMEQYKGKLNAETAQIVIADHYDVYLEQEENPCSRTVCSHYELDMREYMSQPGRPLPYQPRGAVDGVVATSETAQNFTFWGRWGSACGMPFSAAEFLRQHPQFDYLEAFLSDRPSRPWSYLGVE